MQVFDLTSFRRINSNELRIACETGTLRSFENDHKIRVIVADNQFVYATEIDVYNFRMSLVDVMLGMPTSRMITLHETRIRTNQTIDGIFYTWGNIYGGSSILCGNKFTKLMASSTFKNIIGQGLKNVKLELINDQYELTHHELR